MAPQQRPASPPRGKAPHHTASKQLGSGPPRGVAGTPARDTAQGPSRSTARRKKSHGNPYDAIARWFGGFSPPAQATCVRDGPGEDNPELLFHRARDERDHDAFCQLVALLVRPLLTNVARTMLDGDAVQDVVQETLLRAWTQLDDLDSLDHLKAWCYRVARCRMIDALRRQATRPSPMTRVEPERDLQAILTDGVADPAEALLSGPYLGPALAAAIEALPVGYRQVVEMHYLEERSTYEVAERLGINRNTIKVRLLRARRLLRQHIQDHLNRTMGQDAGRVVVHKHGIRTRPGLAARRTDFLAGGPGPRAQQPKADDPGGIDDAEATESS